MLRHTLTFIGYISFLLTSCNAQSVNNPIKMNRQPAVAGTFYPAGKEELSSLLASYFSGANQVLNVQPIAVIVPHAGYVYSGSLAAWAYKQIDREKKFKHIFLIGSSHTNYFKGASIFTAGDFITPLGTVTLDSLAVSLHKTLNYNNDDIGIHAKEHSLEVQLPFLQYWLKHEFSIVPIIIGGDAVETSRKLAETLKPYFTSENLFIISSDFSHYPKYEDANASDKAMAEAILTNSSKIFLKAKATKESSNITNLVTAACGWTSILTLLDITEDKKDVKYQLVKYQNSGDAAIGGKDRVVGYNAICAFKIGTTEVEKTFQLTDEEKFALLKLARKTIQDQIVNSEYNRVSPASYSQNLQADLGAFVTLKKHGELRGCIGNFKPGQPLVKTIQDMAISSATHDYRFSPVEPDEISQLEIEISLLTPMKKINSIDEIELGRHGIYIKKGNSAGTFLPQVATETKWNKEEFLGHCARDKAFIGWDGWKSADIYIYEAIVFSESDFK